MKRNSDILVATLALALMLALPIRANAADYSFQGAAAPEYYPSTNYEDVYGSRYNYGGINVSDNQAAELPYGVTSNTSIGVMEKAGLLGRTVAFGRYSIDSGGVPAAVAEVNGIKNVTPQIVTVMPTR